MDSSGDMVVRANGTEVIRNPSYVDADQACPNVERTLNYIGKGNTGIIFSIMSTKFL